MFYVEEAAYWKDDKFMGVPTAGAKVVNDVLEYPVKNGKQLKLKFTKVSEKEMKHLDAVTYCKNMEPIGDWRLPTERELFDFCAAGVTEPNYGPNFKRKKYPFNARCGRPEDGWLAYWSASVNSYKRHLAWQSNGFDGSVNYYLRYKAYGVRCVGG